eukprot:2347179-Amphidinium_carterae.1
MSIYLRAAFKFLSGSLLGSDFGDASKGIWTTYAMICAIKRNISTNEPTPFRPGIQDSDNNNIDKSNGSSLNQ